MLISSKAGYTTANRKANTIYDLIIAKRIATQQDIKHALQLDSRIRRQVRPGYYEHFKSSPQKPMFYQVFEVLSHVNYSNYDHAYQVNYAAQYAPHKGKKTLRELLGKDGFLTPIWRDGEYIGPRFRYVGTTLPKKAGKQQ